MQRKRTQSWWWAPLLMGGLAAFFYALILLGLRTFPDGDFTHHFLPFSLFLQQEVLEGRLPLWNPYTYSGHPFLADVQAAVFYPVGGLLLAVTLPFTDAGVRLYFLQVEAILQVALAGWFTFLLVRRLTGREDAGLVAGVSFAFSGYLTGYPVVQLAVLRTAIWLPLLLWLVVRAVDSPRRWGRWAAVGVAAAVALLAGHTQTFLYITYAAGVWLIVLLVMHWRTLRQTHAVVATAAGAVLAAAILLGLSAVQLLPSLEYVQLSVRANVDYAYVSGGFPLQDSWQLLLPGVLTQYSPLYIGMIGLGLAFVAVGAALLRSHWTLRIDGASPRAANHSGGALVMTHRTGVLFFFVLATIALLLSYGSNGFLYPIFYRFAPGFDLFRGQERAAYLVAFGLSVLAGYGLLAVHLLPLNVRAWLATLYAGFAIGAIYIFGLVWQLPGRTAVSAAHFLLVATVGILFAAGFALLLRLPGWSRQRTQLLILLCFAGLFWANFTTNLDPFSPARKTRIAPEVEAVQQAAGAAQAASAPAAGRVYNEFRVYEDYGMRVGVEDVWGASPLRLARYARLFEEFPLDRMWRLTSVDHVLTWRRELFVPSTLLAEFPQATDTTYLHQLAQPNPRAWIVSEVVSASDDAAVALLADHTFDLDQRAILPIEATFQLPDSEADALEITAPAATVQISHLAPGRLTVTAKRATPGLLVLSENWMPGWQITSVRWPENAAPPPDEPLRVNLTLLGVPLPAGDVAIEVRYQPQSVRNGLWIGGATLALLAAGAVVMWARTRRQRGAP
jgi:hypothetical protein